MINFNENSVKSNFIKQLLHSFNLPSIKVYKEELKDWVENNDLYIKDNYICKAYFDESNNLQFKRLLPYVFNSSIRNYTKNLKIDSLLYDSHTHEYLGEYLRFIRDYKKLDLMSMYNCFSNNLVDELDYHYFIYDEEDRSKDFFKIKHKNYKIYMVPVKFGCKYTISITSDTPYELFCGFYNKGYVSKNVQITEGENVVKRTLPSLTYQFVSKSNFNEPFIYDKLLLLDNNGNKLFEGNPLSQYEPYLKLFIKIPLNSNSSITVLEGSFINYNDWAYKKYRNKQNQVKENPILISHNKSICNFEFLKDEDKNINLISNLQLQFLNSGTSHPFADRLWEYLSENAVTNIEDISNNIKNLQDNLIRRYDNSKDLEVKVGTRIDENNNTVPVLEPTQGKNMSGLPYYINYGIWENKYKYILYDIAKEEGLINSKNDVLGYEDKDIEIKLNTSTDEYLNRSNIIIPEEE